MFISWWLLVIFVLVVLSFVVNKENNERRLLQRISVLSYDKNELEELLRSTEEAYRKENNALNDKVICILRKYESFVDEVSGETMSLEELDVHVDENAPRMSMLAADQYHKTEQGHKELLHRHIKYGREILREAVIQNRYFIEGFYSD